ncbi:MAG: hypothetical protein WC194_12065 [Mesotoga sp.]|uniref:hypothetical protein n=1 Tax=Mesotoga sp. TaxID=2053577 RepID=UPI003563FADE
MFKVMNPNPNKYIRWYTKAANKCYAGVLVKSNTGADPVAAAHDGATILGVVVETQTAINSEVLIQSVSGTVLEVDIDPSATKQTFAVTDLGSQYDMVVDATTGEQFIDPDDTDGGFLVLVGYDNDRKKAYVTVLDADVYLAC